ncbi:MAG TPA: NUDIX domain-containing protein [Patescibacteria group bacterium]|nr:NUDIX domain-containing protein [Patescibacteria group bacterium]
MKELKKGEDFIGNCVVFFCHDGKGNVVMSKRGQNARDEKGVWDIGGGGIEFGDTVENTLRQEIQQEYGTDVLDYEFLGYRDVHRINNNKPTHWIALDFKVLIDPSKVKNGEPHKFDDVKMFSVKDLPKEIHSQFPLFLKLYKEKLGI